MEYRHEPNVIRLSAVEVHLRELAAAVAAAHDALTDLGVEFEVASEALSPVNVELDRLHARVRAIRAGLP